MREFNLLLADNKLNRLSVAITNTIIWRTNPNKFIAQVTGDPMLHSVIHVLMYASATATPSYIDWDPILERLAGEIGRIRTHQMDMYIVRSIRDRIVASLGPQSNVSMRLMELIPDD